VQKQRIFISGVAGFLGSPASNPPPASIPPTDNGPAVAMAPAPSGVTTQAALTDVRR